MKTLILFFSMIVSQLTFAGTGGGGVMMAALSQNSEIVYHMGEQDGVVKFAHGQLIQGQWEVENIQMSKAELVADLTVVTALEKSKSAKDWAVIK